MEGSRGAGGWDRLLASWPAPSLLQSYGWGEVQARAGWRLSRVVVEVSGRPLPLSVQVGPLGPPRALRLYLPRGPACAPDDAAAFLAVERELVRLGRREWALAIEVEPNWEVGAVPAGHPIRAWAPCPSRQPLATTVVDLRPEPDAILASFHSKTRYNVRLAERRGVRVREGGLEELDRCLRATEGRQQVRLPPRGHLSSVLGQLGELARVWVAEARGEVVAAALLARCGPELVYLYGGATGAHREDMPNHLLHWRAMMEGREEGCTDYDLWGVPEDDRPDHPWHGLAQFKLGFAGRQVRYLGARRRQLVPGGVRVLRALDRSRLLGRSRRVR
ncbi:MAG: peptidoglycan bridge formation glycyltransferase FemA/FemB family protein [Candidatus Dormibacteraeota bacterium]|nr:peptidoglycan bridge formation glycyltransferase FemA/FemB family protein [Candidatus Dormibacteraeota bacterium]